MTHGVNITDVPELTRPADLLFPIFEDKATFTNNVSSTSSIGQSGRIVLGSWSLVTAIIGGFGNILILTGIYADKFRLETTSKWFISNWSVSDILYVLTIVVPSIFSNFADRWLFGTFFCRLTANLRSSLCIVHIFSLTLLAARKFLRCIFPLKSMYLVLNTGSGIFVTLCMWVLAFIPVVICYVFDRPFNFDTNINRCTIHDENLNSFWVSFNKICFMAYVGLPLLINIFCNVGLLFIVLRKAAIIVDTSKILMIISLSGLSILAWLPAIIYGTVLNSSGYPMFMRFANYAISLDATFSTILFMYFYPAFWRYVKWVLSCGRKGELEVERSQARARVISTVTFVPLKDRLARELTSRTLALRSASIPENTKSRPPRPVEPIPELDNESC